MAEIRLIDNFENEEIFEKILNEMDPEKKERAGQMRPCSDEDFICNYLDLDPGFRQILKNQFGVIVDYDPQ